MLSINLTLIFYLCILWPPTRWCVRAQDLVVRSSFHRSNEKRQREYLILGAKKVLFSIKEISVNLSAFCSPISPINTLEVLYLLPSFLTDLQGSQKCLSLGCLIGNTPIVSFYEMPKKVNKFSAERRSRRNDHKTY